MSVALEIAGRQDARVTRRLAALELKPGARLPEQTDLVERTVEMLSTSRERVRLTNELVALSHYAITESRDLLKRGR